VCVEVEIQTEMRGGDREVGVVDLYAIFCVLRRVISITISFSPPRTAYLFAGRVTQSAPLISWCCNGIEG
jgi:hypothetical protein